MKTDLLSCQRLFLSSHPSSGWAFLASYGRLPPTKSSPILLSLNRAHKTFTVGRYPKSHQQTLSTGTLRWLSFSASLESNSPCWASIVTSFNSEPTSLSFRLNEHAEILVASCPWFTGKPVLLEIKGNQGGVGRCVFKKQLSKVLGRPWLFIRWTALISLCLEW